MAGEKRDGVPLKQRRVLVYVDFTLEQQPEFAGAQDFLKMVVKKRRESRTSDRHLNLRRGQEKRRSNICKEAEKNRS